MESVGQAGETTASTDYRVSTASTLALSCSVPNIRLVFVIDLVGSLLVVSIFAAAFGGGGLFGRWAGEHIIYPVRVGNNRPATRYMWSLVLAGLAVLGAFLAIVSLLSLDQAES